MYLKTPKRYSAKRRKRYLLSYRRIGFWLLALVFIFGGWYVYRERSTLAPIVSTRAEALYYDGSELVSTLTAPTPLPTENPLNLVSRADANWSGGRVEDAMVDYTQAVESLPNDVVTHYRYTMALIIEGRYVEAVEAAEDAITADPYSSEAWSVRALAQVRAGDPGSALASGQHALQLNPENASAYAFLTEAYLDLNQIERAREAAQQAIDLNPNSADAYYARAQVTWLADGDLETAAADFQTVYEIAPYYVDAAVNAAVLKATVGNAEEAVAILNAAKDANPDNPTILVWLGIIYNREYGDPNQAADVLARCVEVNETSDGCHFWYGRVLLSLEQYNEAATVLDRAVQLTNELGTPDPRYHYWAGEAQIYLGNCPAALGYLQEGYDIALANDQPDYASDLQGSIRECSAFDSTFSPTATPAVIQPGGAQTGTQNTPEPQQEPVATVSPNI